MIDLNKYKETKVKLTSENTKNEYEMSQYEVCRWFSLIEAVDIVSQKADQLGPKAEDVNWIKPIALQKYIDERTESMLFELESDLNDEAACTI